MLQTRICGKSLSALSGTLFVLGIPNVWRGLAENDSYIPDVIQNTLGASGCWGVLLVAAGLLLLGLTLLRSSENPYGYFAFGCLPGLAATLVDFAIPRSSYVSFPLLGAAYVLLLTIFCRRPESAKSASQ